MAKTYGPTVTMVAGYLIYGNRRGRVGARALSAELLDFRGDIDRGQQGPALSMEGRGTLQQTEKGSEVEFKFVTKGQKQGEEWTGSGVLYVISSDLLQGWFSDQLRRYERVEVKRSF